MPTDTGDIVNKFLTEHFAQYVDHHFTAKRRPARRNRRRQTPLDSRDGQILETVHQASGRKEGIERAKFTTQELDETCRNAANTNCKISSAKWAASSPAAAYPRSAATRATSTKPPKKPPSASPKREAEQAELDGREYFKCGGRLVYKYSRTGSKFIGCANYPKCKHVEPLENPERYRRPMPAMQKGKPIERKSRYGNCFTVTSTHPDCNYATWNPPVAEECPNCHWPVLTIKPPNAGA